MFDPRFTRWRIFHIPQLFHAKRAAAPAVAHPLKPFRSFGPKPAKRRRLPVSSHWGRPRALVPGLLGGITGVRVEVLEVQTPVRVTGTRAQTVARETPFRMTGIRVQLVVPIMPGARIGKLRNYAL